MPNTSLQFPIGPFEKLSAITAETLLQWVNDIETFPTRLKKEVAHLNNKQLDTEYRPNGWTIRQVVHHCADSHMNSFIRLKLALTEEKPIIKPYFEDRWAALSDSKQMHLTPSLKILEGIHESWVLLLSNLTPKDLEKAFIHPEHGKAFTLDEYIGIYAWHSNHHLAHITVLKTSQGWNN